MSVVLHFLGEPYVEIDGARMSVPLRKAEAMLFYVAFEGRVPRDRLKLLFWGDKDENQASNNLRNAVYLLKKALPDHISVDRRYVSLEGAVRDIDLLAAIDDPAVPIDKIFFEEPLRALDTIGMPEFEEWLGVVRSAIKKKIVVHLRTRIAACYEGELGEELAESLSTLLAFEPFDEDSVLELMEAYCKLGAVAYAISLYSTYRERVRAEIGIAPSKRAEEFFRRIAASGRASDLPKQPGEFFCCRDGEVEKILDFVSHAKPELGIALIHGEAGVGKTALAGRVLELLAEPDATVFSTRPHSVGENYPYSSWNGMISKVVRTLKEKKIAVDPFTLSVLSGVFFEFFEFYDFFVQGEAIAAPDMGNAAERNPRAVGKLLAGVVGKLAQAGRTIFVFEDLHWFDAQSLLLLKAFLSEFAAPATVFMTTRPESVGALSEMLYAIRTEVPHQTLAVELTPFSPEDTLRLCRVFLAEDVIRRRGEDYFIRGSEGMPLLLMEMIKILSENPDADCAAGLKGVIMSRMEDMTPLQREALSVLSAFGYGASLEDVAAVMGADVGALIEAVEGMMQKHLVREVQDEERCPIDFFHANVRECVYEGISGFKRRELHRRIAERLNGGYSPHVWNPSLSALLRYHYKAAGMPLQVLSQHIREMSFHIALNHVLFPLVRDKVLLSCSIPFSSREDTESKIRQVRELLNEIALEIPAGEREELRRMEASYLEIWGGYLINWGDYREGRALINRALALAREHGFDEVQIHCLEHLGHLFLQTDNSGKLFATGREILHLARQTGQENHMGLALRFIGVAKVIERSFDYAEKIFTRSVELFEELAMMGRRYTLNELAARCYIGEIRQWTGDTEAAKTHFDYCIAKCRESGLFWGRSHFHGHAADVAFEMGDWDAVCRHIDEGVTLFESSKGGHCGSMLYSFKAIVDARRGSPETALDALKKGDWLATISKKSWCAAHFMAKAWIARMIERGELNGARFAAYLDKPANIYAEVSEGLYREIGAERRADLVREEFGLQ